MVKNKLDKELYSYLKDGGLASYITDSFNDLPRHKKQNVVDIFKSLIIEELSNNKDFVKFITKEVLENYDYYELLSERLGQYMEENKLLLDEYMEEN